MFTVNFSPLKVLVKTRRIPMMTTAIFMLTMIIMMTKIIMIMNMIF